MLFDGSRWRKKAPPPLTPRKPQTNKPLESEEGEKIADKRSHKLINEINNKSWKFNLKNPQISRLDLLLSVSTLKGIHEYFFFFFYPFRIIVWGGRLCFPWWRRISKMLEKKIKILFRSYHTVPLWDAATPSNLQVHSLLIAGFFAPIHPAHCGHKKYQIFTFNFDFFYQLGFWKFFFVLWIFQSPVFASSTLSPTFTAVALTSRPLMGFDVA